MIGDRDYRAPRVGRVGFVADQCLDAGDLAQASARSAALLDLHIARGHDVWGVATGYSCSVTDGAVTVGTGVAVDLHGHQLVNPEPATIPLPPVPAPIGDFARGAVFDLVVCWATKVERGCEPAGMPVERVLIRWVLAGPTRPANERPAAPLPYAVAVRLGRDVPIARLTVPSGDGAPTLDLRSRPVAHGLVRPKIATGQVRQSSTQVYGTYTNWRMWVDTSAAGFVSASPAYLANLDAHPFADTANLGAAAAGIAGAAGALPPPDLGTRLSTWIGPFASIEDQSQQGFWLRVCVAVDDDWARAQQPTAFANPVAVSWVGVETVTRPFRWVSSALVVFTHAQFFGAATAQKGGVA